MKKHSLVIVLLALGYVLPSSADDSMGNMDMGKMPMSKPAAQEAKSTSKMANGTGIINSIDAVKGTLVLHHQAIKALSWPPMTMSFKVADPKLLKGLKAGQHVDFELKAEGMGGVVTAISPAK